MQFLAWLAEFILFSLKFHPQIYNGPQFKIFKAGEINVIKIVLKSLDKMEDLHGSAYFQFLRAQLQLILIAPKGRRFDKQILVVAAEIYGISPAAYKMIYRSGVLAIPSVSTI